QAQRFLGFLREIHKLRRGRLKLECHFVGLDAGLNFGIANFGESHFIKSSNTVERRTLGLGVPAGGVGEIEDRVASTAEWNSRVGRGKKPAAPITGAATRAVGAAQNAVARQILRFAAEAIQGPCS